MTARAWGISMERQFHQNKPHMIITGTVRMIRIPVRTVRMIRIPVRTVRILAIPKYFSKLYPIGQCLCLCL